MSPDFFVSYLRPGFVGQERSGTLTSQREAVWRHLGRRGRLVGEVIETAEDRQRPGLRAALNLCRRQGATLLMADLGPLCEDPDFLRRLSRALRASDLRFSTADQPEVSERTLGIMAALAEAEDRLGVRRTPETMARRREFYARFTAERRATHAPEACDMAAMATPRPLAESLERGASTSRSRERAEEMAPILNEIRAAGALTLEQVANALNALGIPSARGGRWYPMQVTRVEKRLAAARDVASLGASPPGRPLSASTRASEARLA